MKIQVLSDLHLEFAGCLPKATAADVVVLAGDIGVGDIAISWAKNTFNSPVLYVAGNHEYYNPMFTMSEHAQLIKSEALGSNVTVLDNDVVIIDGVRFIGTTLWTDLVDFDAVLYSDADRIIINDGWEHFNSHFAQELFERNICWLQDEITKTFDGKTVVISHHAPSFKSIHSQYKGNPWNPCFSSDLEGLMGGKVDLWVHGHTHNSFNYVVKGTRIVCNPRGYPSATGGWENPSFDYGLVINI